MKRRTYVNKHVRRLKRRGPDRLVRVKGHPRKVQSRSKEFHKHRMYDLYLRSLSDDDYSQFMRAPTQDAAMLAKRIGRQNLRSRRSKLRSRVALLALPEKTKMHNVPESYDNYRKRHEAMWKYLVEEP